MRIFLAVLLKQLESSEKKRKRVNLLGFLNSITYETERVMNGSYLNSDSVCERLEKLRKKCSDEVFV